MWVTFMGYMKTGWEEGNRPWTKNSPDGWDRGRGWNFFYEERGVLERNPQNWDAA